MLTGEKSSSAWKELAAMIATLPPEEQKRYRGSIRELIHDLRQCLAIHHSAEALLRMTIPNTPENLELLDSIRSANQRALSLITDFAHPFDKEENPAGDGSDSPPPQSSRSP